jgi:Fe2+ transport system protein FeoA
VGFNLLRKKFKESRMSTSASLADLGQGESCVVKALQEGGDAELRRELLELGFVPGTAVRLVAKSLFGEPLAFELRGTRIALRKAEAAMVLR